MNRWFAGTMVVVAVVCIVWSRLVLDPNCTEGPCSQDGPIMLAVVVDALIGLAWLITAIVGEVDSVRRDRKR